jgi:enamine deaminase RidA (YjgF/YER057c/UK114 family)
MPIRNLKVSICLAALAFSASPALADDCATVVASMKATAVTPYASTATRTDPQGKPQTRHMIRTTTKTYVEDHGGWVEMDITSQDLTDTINEQLKTAKMTCQKVGTEAVNGQATTVYTVHIENEGSISDNKLWLNAKNLPLKTVVKIQGMKADTEATYDYDHVQAPADAKPIGSR